MYLQWSHAVWCHRRCQFGSLERITPEKPPGIINDSPPPPQLLKRSDSGG